MVLFLSLLNSVYDTIRSSDTIARSIQSLDKLDHRYLLEDYKLMISCRWPI